MIATLIVMGIFVIASLFFSLGGAPIIGAELMSAACLVGIVYLMIRYRYK